MCIKKMKNILSLIIALPIAFLINKLLFRLQFVDSDHQMGIWACFAFFMMGVIFVFLAIRRERFIFYSLALSCVFGTGSYLHERYVEFPSLITINGVFYQKNGLFGFKDKNGRVLINPEYERVIPFSEYSKCGYSDGIGILYKNEKFYLANTYGNIFEVERFQSDGKEINVQHEQKLFVNGLTFDWISGTNSTFIVPLSGQYTIIDKSGNFAFNLSFNDYMIHPTAGYVWIQRGGKWDIVGLELNNIGSDKLVIKNKKSFDKIQIDQYLVRVQLGNNKYNVYQDEGDIIFQQIADKERDERMVSVDKQLLLMLMQNTSSNNVNPISTINGVENNVYEKSSINISSIPCSTCKGKGWIPGCKTTTYGQMGERFCEECNMFVGYSHSHDPCPSCYNVR